MTIPLSKFSGYLKQMNRELFTDIVKVVMDNGFPKFWPSDPESDELRQQEKKLRESGVSYIIRDLNPPRRFSGCLYFPKGRYFSLCLDELGNDEGTLVNELNSYLDPLKGGLILFGDMALPGSPEKFEHEFGIKLSQGSYIILLIVGRPGAISPIIDALVEQELVSLDEISDQRKGYSLVAVQIPYIVTSITIKDIFDLRLPECQEFLVEQFFQKNTSNLTKDNRLGINRFIEALPLMMSPELGGGRIHSDNGGILTALAAFIRSQGAQALIYPSARSNVFLEIENRNLKQWRGWCLVDYRKAEEPLMQTFHDFSVGWPKMFPKGSSVRFADNEKFAGSFEITGIVEWNRERVTELEQEFLDNQKMTKKF